MVDLSRIKAVSVAAAMVLGGMIALPGIAQAESDAKHKVVIQVSTDDVRTQKIALNNAVNLQKMYGDDVEIEIVAYGPGLSILTPKSPQSKRVPSLATFENITFSACGNTMKKIAKKTGKEPKLVDGVRVVKAGVARIMELQHQGYAYIRP